MKHGIQLLSRIFSFLLCCAVLASPIRSAIAQIDPSPFTEGDICLTGFFPAPGPKGKWGFVDKSGRMIIPATFDEVGWFNAVRTGLAAVRIGTKWGYINQKGDLVVPASYDDAMSFPMVAGYYVRRITAFNLANGLAPVKSNGKWYFIDSRNNQIAGPFAEANTFLHGFAGVKSNGKWGFINSLGKIAIPAIYDDCGYFSEGLAPVLLNGKWGYINEKGELKIKPSFDHANPFREGLASVYMSKDSRMGFIDSSGKMVIPAQYAFVSDFNDGLSIVAEKEQRNDTGVTQRFFAIYRDGKVAFDLPNRAGLDRSSTFNEGVVFVQYPKRIDIGSDYLLFQANGIFYKDGRKVLWNDPENAETEKSIGIRRGFRNGLAFAAISGFEDGDKYIGYVDKEGKWVYKISWRDWMGLPAPSSP